MAQNDTPRDGDFAAALEGRSAPPKAAAPNPPFAALSPASAIPSPQPDQSIVDVLLHGQEPTEALLQSLRDDNDLPPVSDEELEQQALQHPGGDGDPDTPE